jgi:hypothetical protein
MHPWPTADGRELVAAWTRLLKRPPNAVEVQALQEFVAVVVNELPTIAGAAPAHVLLATVHETLTEYAQRPSNRTPARDSDVVLRRLHTIRDGDRGDQR